MFSNPIELWYNKENRGVNMKNILVVEKNEYVIDILNSECMKDNCILEHSKSMLDAYKLVFTRVFDLIVIDYRNSYNDILALIKEIVESNITKNLIVLYDITNQEQELELIEAGVVHIIDGNKKPEILLARIKGIVNSMDVVQDRVIKSTIDSIELHLEKRKVLKEGTLVKLSEKEYLLLEYLFSNLNRTIHRKELYEQIWNDSDNLENSRIVDIYVAKIRKKLGLSSIKSKRGEGYEFLG